jgi:hypothetical protein
MQKQASQSNMKLVDLARAVLAAEPFVVERSEWGRSSRRRGPESAGGS